MKKKLWLSLMLFSISCGGASPDSDVSTDSEEAPSTDSEPDSDSATESESESESESEQETDTVPYEPQSCVGEVFFKDAAFETAVRKMISWYVLGGAFDSVYSGTVTGELMAQVDYLEFAAATGIESIEGIECLVNAERIMIGGNEIQDIQLLAFLKRLKEAYLQFNLISDLEPLRELTSLVQLHFTENLVKDLSPLSGLVNLDSVSFENNQVESLAPLSQLPMLESFSASGNRINDISPIVTMPILLGANLNDNEIEDLSPLAGQFHGRRMSFELSGNGISDISPLSGLLLGNTDFSNNLIEDISALAEGITPVPDPWLDGGIRGPNLLYLNGNKIKDISVLANLGDYPTDVTLFDNQIEDLFPLVGTAYSQASSFYDFSNNRISDVSPLASFSELQYLDIHNNSVADLSPLKGIHLTSLFAAGNQIHDLTPLLSDMVYVGEALDLTDNQIVSINPLTTIGKVRANGVPYYVYLMGNPLGEFALTEDIPFLCGLNRSEIFYGDGETCDWNGASTAVLPAYTYPPEPFSGVEPEKPEVCAALPNWLVNGALPDLSRTGAEFTVDESVVGEPTVEDTITGLSWRRCSEGQLWDGDTCTGTATAVAPDELSEICAGSYGGFDNWRRPSLSELNTLVSYDIEYPGPIIEAATFPNTYPGNYWTTDSPPYVWLNFYNGTASLAESTPGRIRCVRGGSDTVPEERFSLTGETVMDALSGLEWRRCAVGQTLTGDACEGLGDLLSFAAAETVCTGDFRLPSITELFSLVNPCAADPSAYTAAFPDVPPALFWSDTTFPDFDEKQWAVYFGLGSTEPLLVDANARVRCVR